MLKRVIVLLMALGMCLGLFAGCVDYGYTFHFYVDGGNGEITTENESLMDASSSCEVPWCKLDCPEGSRIVDLLGGKKGSHKLTFIANPDEGYQVKEWLFNGEIVEGNKTNSYKATVSSEQNYNGVISVRFEVIQGENSN